MGLDVFQMGAHFGKFLMFIVRKCYRSVCKHPFLAAMLLFLIYLYESVPFVFSLLVSSSPIIICTAALLGTLLSFGHPNIPEIEKEDKREHDIASLKTGVSDNATIVVERDDRGDVERFTVKRRDIVEKVNEDTSFPEEKVSLVGRDDSSVDHLPLIDENSREVQREKQAIEEMDKEYDKVELEQKDISDGIWNKDVSGDNEEIGNQYLRVREEETENHEGEDVKSSEESVDDESSDSESDSSESSSPDTSMTDVLPMLDELHPLLHSEAPQQSHKSNEGSDDLDEDTENHEEDGDDDIDDDDEETQVGKEDTANSAITWTEADQKNLMDLGTSELERNQRLENLIARRRLRRSMKLMAEKNLIDLEGTDLPFQVAPISTVRHNPFDLPYDSYDETGLLSLPGSAPSILLPRRNPFDLPYESNEEKPDLTGDGFQQEYMPVPQKDTMFRRHESFSVGPSMLGVPRQDKHDLKFRPYFVPERIPPEGTSFPSFQRQSSEMSDSKLSSIPDTESTVSAMEQEDKKILGQGIPREAEEMICNIDHASVDVQHGSSSSEDIDSEESDQSERRDIDLNKVETEFGAMGGQGEVESGFSGRGAPQSGLSETGEPSMAMELNEKLNHIKADEIEDKDSSGSSSSPLSEENEEMIDVKEREVLAPVEPGKGVSESGGSIQAALEDSGFEVAGGIIHGCENRDPVYDSSPPAFQKLLSSSSISSDLNMEMSEVGSPESVKVTVPHPDDESVACKDSIEKGSCENVASSISSNLSVETSKMGSPESVKTTMPSPDDESEVCKDSAEKGTPLIGGLQAAPSLARTVDKAEILSEQPLLEVEKQPHTEAHTNLSAREASAGSSYQSMLSEEKSLPEVGEQLPGIEIPTVERSLDNSEVQEANISTTTNVAKADQSVDKVFSDSYAFTPGGTSIPFEESQSRGSACSQAGNLGGADNEDRMQVLHNLEHITAEEEDEIKDIDEGLLSELDAVCDFSVKKRDLNIDEISRPLHADRGRTVLHDSERKFTQGDCSEKIDETVAVTSPQNVFESKEISEIHQPSSNAETTPEHTEVEHSESELKLPVAEARTIEDSDLALKRSSVEDYNEKVDETVTVISPKNDLEPKKISEDEIEKPVVDGSFHAETTPEHIEVEHPGSKLKLPIVEAKVIEDIDLAFKRAHEEGTEVEKSVLISSGDNNSLPVEEPKDSFEISPELRVSEARTIEGIEKPPELDTRDGLGEVEIKEVVSSKDIESTAKEQAVEEGSTSSQKHNYGVEDPKEFSVSSVSRVTAKKAKSPKSNSGSSSSSSDSD